MIKGLNSSGWYYTNLSHIRSFSAGRHPDALPAAAGLRSPTIHSHSTTFWLQMVLYRLGPHIFFSEWLSTPGNLEFVLSSRSLFRELLAQAGMKLGTGTRGFRFGSFNRPRYLLAKRACYL